MELLELCLDQDKFQFLPHLGNICAALARSCADENPEMKQKVSSFASQLAQALPEKCGNFMKTTVDGLTQNLGHQHSKVRKVTLRGLKEVAIARNAELCLIDSISTLRLVMNDRSTDVRKTFYEVLKHWMVKMDIQSLKQFEANLVLFLLNGVSDECQEISEGCIQFLEEHGNRMRDALRQLGDEDIDMK